MKLNLVEAQVNLKILAGVDRKIRLLHASAKRVNEFRILLEQNADVKMVVFTECPGAKGR